MGYDGNQALYAGSRVEEANIYLKKLVPALELSNLIKLRELGLITDHELKSSDIFKKFMETITLDDGQPKRGR